MTRSNQRIMHMCKDLRDVGRREIGCTSKAECGVTEHWIKAESLCPSSKRQYPLGILVVMGRGRSIMNAKRKCFECVSVEEKKL